MKTTNLKKIRVEIKRPSGANDVRWQVTFPKLGGGRERRFFKEEEDADIFLGQQEIIIRNHGTAAASMPQRLREDAVRAEELLKPFNASILDAATFYANHLKASRGGLLISEAVELFKKTRDIKRKTAPSIGGVAKTRKEEEADYIYSPHYRKALAHYLKRFAEAFPEKTSRDITSGEIEAFLTDCGALETIKTYRKTIKAMFNFLVEEGHCDKNPVRKSKSDEIGYSVEILAPEQCAKLLASCDAETLPSVAIGMFCGLRSSEIERLEWNRINLAEKIIILDTTVARKTGSRRVVPIHETCAQWLTPYAKKSGPVQTADFRNRFDRVRVKAGFLPSFSKRNDDALQALLKAAKEQKEKLAPWPSNCLRHSAISYAMADCGDQSKVASWAGNSPAMIKKHYDAQATPSAAKAFYGISPSTPENVFRMKPASTKAPKAKLSPIPKAKKAG